MHPERAPVLAVDPSWSTTETRIKELETLLATERSARERAERALKHQHFHAGHAIGLHMVIELAREVSNTGDAKADKNITNCIARSREVQQWLEPLVHAASSSETIQSSPEEPT